MISIAGERMTLAKNRSIQPLSIYRSDSWQIMEPVVQRVNCFQYFKRQGDFGRLLIALSCSVSVGPIWVLGHYSSHAVTLFTMSSLEENEVDGLGCLSKVSISTMTLHKVFSMFSGYIQVVVMEMICWLNGRCLSSAKVVALLRLLQRLDFFSVNSLKPLVVTPSE